MFPLPLSQRRSPQPPAAPSCIASSNSPPCLSPQHLPKIPPQPLPSLLTSGHVTFATFENMYDDRDAPPLVHPHLHFPEFQNYIHSKISKLLSSFSTELTLVIDKLNGLTPNPLFAVAHLYLKSQEAPNMKRFCATMSWKLRHVSLFMDDNDEIIDSFNGVEERVLAFGSPGTGKLSLIAVMANYLNFDVYDLELTVVNGNSDLRKLLIATRNHSILVVEDIDCSLHLQGRLAKRIARSAIYLSCFFYYKYTYNKVYR
ncbi:Protein HYPER-SENSITIVITY-RELATED 4 [Vigna angularis]|uniref:Protein HYPER-SENSITIVITY-RELATED 4 n=1 Tax=Phaseolus angularis TaxID=3914 RepID=A0A8T0K7X2_PHAAN|nr:Protein HYPER-SENSITIVITY-RELATED 4 [Vigna angularis]